MGEIDHATPPHLPGRHGLLPKKSMRNQIQRLCAKELITHGYRGFRFQHIADGLGITRGNIHYHFGSKRELAEATTVEYTQATLKIFEEIWNSPDTSLEKKIQQTRDFNFERYSAFNPDLTTGNPWSLIARMRTEREMLGERGREALAQFSDGIYQCIRRGIEHAIGNGELRPETPVSDITLQLVAIANSAGPITQDAGGFDRLDQLYSAVSRIVRHAYGDPGRGP